MHAALGDSLTPPGGATSADWINPAAFATPAAGTFGNAGRDIARAPHLWQADFGASKRIALTERYQLQFRAEAFNIFNRGQLGAPISDIMPKRPLPEVNPAMLMPCKPCVLP